MSTLKQRCGMILLLCVAICACGTQRGDDSNAASSMANTANTANSGSSMGSGTGGSSVGAATGVSDAGNAATAGSTGVASASHMAGYGTVQSIEPGTRQDIGVGTLGAAAAGGSMGSPGDKVYRVSVRMDDGSTQSLVLDSMPSSYKVGDRVRYSNGGLQRSAQ